MSKPKDPGKQRRLLLVPGVDAPQTVSEAIAWLEWATDGPVRAIAVDLARGHYLRALSDYRPRVLGQLRDLKGQTDPARLDRWAEEWRLPPWALAWAQATVRLSGGRYWCHPTEGEGAWIADAPPAARPRTSTEIAEAAPLMSPQAFTWLAQFQTGRPYTAIAVDGGSTPGNVQRDCRRLAALIGLSMRATSRGPAKKKIRPVPSE